jgi:hypothetical protein
MVPINVAVVPYGVPTIESEDARNDLTRVTAALQIQVARDFAPIWGVNATVTPFLSLEHVPVGYMAVVLAADVPLKTHGVHYAAGSRPFALVRYADLKDPGNWSVTASHELLEMLCDPWGNRVMPGRAIGAGVGPDANQVEYLVEVCDPCQTITYLIDGVLVSDFVTPDYYSPYATDGLRYSFTGKIPGPRTVAPGGYITWRTPGSEAIFQQRGRWSAQNKPKQIGGFNLLSGLSLREYVDSKDTPALAMYSKNFPDKKTMTAAAKAYDASKAAAQKYGRALRRDIGNLLPVDARSDPRTRPDDRVDLVDILERLGSDPKFYKAYKKNPRAAIRSNWEKLAEDIALDSVPEKKIEKLAPPEVFAWHAEQLRTSDGDRDFGDAVFLPGGALWWLAALGGG